MSDFPLSRQEWRILIALWELGQGTADELIVHCKFKPGLGRRAARALLKKMVRKGVVVRHKPPMESFFAPCVGREQVARLCVQALLKEGSLSDLLMDNLESIDEFELKQIEELIQSYRAGAGEHKNA